MNSLLSLSNFFLSRAMLLVRAAQLEPRQVAVVEEDVVLAVDLVDDEVGDDVVVAAAA